MMVFKDELDAVIEYINENVDIPNMDEKVEGILINLIMLILAIVVYFVLRCLTI